METVFEVTLYDRKAGDYIVLVGDIATNTYRMLDLSTWQRLSSSDELEPLELANPLLDQKHDVFGSWMLEDKPKQISGIESLCLDYTKPIFTSDQSKQIYIVELAYLPNFMNQIAERVSEDDSPELILVARGIDVDVWQSQITSLEKLPSNFTVTPTFTITTKDLSNEDLLTQYAAVELDVFNWLKVHGIKHSLLKVYSQFVSRYNIQERMILAFIENEISELDTL